MTNIEKEAIWIQNERQSLIKLSNEINALVFEYNIRSKYDHKYYISYGTETAGRHIEIRIHDSTTCKEVETKYMWCLNSIFLPDQPIDALRQSIKNAKSKLREIKKLAQKYISINEK